MTSDAYTVVATELFEEDLDWAVGVYHIDEDTRRVTLMRLFYCKADWKMRLMDEA